MKITLSVLFVLFASVVNAQTTTKIEWDYLQSTMADVQSQTHTASVDGTNVATPIACAPSGANVTCNVTIPALSSGSHNVKVAATKNNITKEASITGLNPTSPGAPKEPTNFRYNISININVP